MKKYTWRPKVVGTYYHENETGKIVAEYSRINFSDEVYHATVNGDFLGQYIDEKFARKAIEKKVKELDEQEEYYKKNGPTVA